MSVRRGVQTEQIARTLGVCQERGRRRYGKTQDANLAHSVTPLNTTLREPHLRPRFGSSGINVDQEVCVVGVAHTIEGPQWQEYRRRSINVPPPSYAQGVGHSDRHGSCIRPLSVTECRDPVSCSHICVGEGDSWQTLPDVHQYLSDTTAPIHWEPLLREIHADRMM